MRYMKKWAGLAAVILLIVSCFAPWIYIEVVNITVSGVDGSGTNYGDPGYFHFVFAALFCFFFFIRRIWAKQWNLLVAAINLGWGIRNYFKLSACEAGECPVRKWGLYLMLLASVLMLVAALFPDMKLKERERQS